MTELTIGEIVKIVVAVLVFVVVVIAIILAFREYIIPYFQGIGPQDMAEGSGVYLRLLFDV